MKYLTKPVLEHRVRSLVREAPAALMGLLSIGACAGLLFAASTTFATGM